MSVALPPLLHTLWSSPRRATALRVYLLESKWLMFPSFCNVEARKQDFLLVQCSYATFLVLFSYYKDDILSGLSWTVRDAITTTEDILAVSQVPSE